MKSTLELLKLDLAEFNQYGDQSVFSMIEKELLEKLLDLSKLSRDDSLFSVLERAARVDQREDTADAVVHQQPVVVEPLMPRFEAIDIDRMIELNAGERETLDGIVKNLDPIKRRYEEYKRSKIRDFLTDNELDASDEVVDRFGAENFVSLDKIALTDLSSLAQPIDQAEQLKFQANLIAITDMSPFMFQQLLTQGVTSLLAFINQDVEALSRKLVERMMEEETIDWPEEDKIDLIKEYIQRIGLNEAELLSVETYLHEHQEELEQNPGEFFGQFLGELLELKLFDWTFVVRRQLQTFYKNKWERENHDCTFEQSSLSELAYLKHLMDTYRYTPDQVNTMLNERGLVTEPLGVSHHSQHWHHATEITQAIAVIQADLRKLGKLGNPNEKEFYTTNNQRYSQWLTAQLRILYAENYFPELAAEIKSGIQFQFDLNEAESIEKWYRKIDEVVEKIEAETDSDLNNVKKLLRDYSKYFIVFSSFYERGFIGEEVLSELSSLSKSLPHSASSSESYRQTMNDLREKARDGSNILILDFTYVLPVLLKKFEDGVKNRDHHDYGGYTESGSFLNSENEMISRFRSFVFTGGGDRGEEEAIKDKLESFSRELMSDYIYYPFYGDVDGFPGDGRIIVDNLSDRVKRAFKVLKHVLDGYNVDKRRKYWRDYPNYYYRLIFEANYYSNYLYYFLVRIALANIKIQEACYEEAEKYMALIVDLTDIDKENYGELPPMGTEYWRDNGLPLDNYFMLTPFDLVADEIALAKLTLARVWSKWADALFRKDGYERIQLAQLLCKRILRLFPIEDQHQAQHNLFSTDETSLQSVDRLQKLAKIRLARAAHREKSFVVSPVMPVDVLTGGKVFEFDRGLFNEKKKKKERDWLSKAKFEALVFCHYPNPEILIILRETLTRLQFIENHQNYLGYQEGDRLHYTFERLYQETSRALSFAKTFGQSMIAFQESAEAEKEKVFLAKKAAAIVRLESGRGDLQVQQAELSLKLGQTGQESANTQYDYLDGEYQYYNNPGNTFLLALRDGGLNILGHVNGLAKNIYTEYKAAEARDHNQVAQYLNDWLGPDTVPKRSVPKAKWGQWGVKVGIDFAKGFFKSLLNSDKYRKALAHQRKLAEFGKKIAQDQVKILEASLDVARAAANLSRLRAILSQDYLEGLAEQELNVTSYLRLVIYVKQLCADYIDVATRYAWLMQQRLAFEYGVPMRVIRFDYYAQSKGETDFRGLLYAAERLEADVEHLRNHRILSREQQIVLQKTISLRETFPVQFIEFLLRGNMRFSTSVDYLKIKQEENDQGTYLVYDGHYEHPDFLGHYQQRVDHVEIRVFGIIPPSSDLSLTLTNTTPSLLLIKKPGESEPTPSLLPHEYRRVVFDSALQSTAQDYAVFSSQGELKPFEGVTVSTGWEVSLPDHLSSRDQVSIFDVQMVMHYSAQYDPAYAALQETRVEGVSKYQYLPNEGVDNTVTVLSENYPQAYYSFRKPTYTEPGFRDLRFVTFEIDHDVPDWQRSPNTSSMHVYLPPEGKAKLTGFEFPYTEVNTVEGKPAFLLRHRVKLVGEFEDPITAQKSSIQGLAYTADLAQETDEKRDLKRYPSRRCTLKFFPENLPPDKYVKRNMMEQKVNTSGKAVSPFFGTGKLKDILSLQTANLSNPLQRSVALKIPATQLSQWNYYRWEMKVMLGRGNTVVKWMAKEKQFLSIAITPNQMRGLSVGYQNIAGNIVFHLDNVMPVQLAAGEWYQLACVSMPYNGDTDRTYVQLYLDNELLWAGDFELNAQKNPGAMKIECGNDTLMAFDDLLVQAVDAKGKPVRKLFVDNFQSEEKWQKHWEVSNADAVDKIGLADDPNLEMDLSAIADVVHSVNYQYQCGPRP